MAKGKKRLQEIRRELDEPYDIESDLMEQFIRKKLLISETRFIRSRMIRNKYKKEFFFTLFLPACLFLGAFVFLVAIVGR